MTDQKKIIDLLKTNRKVYNKQFNCNTLDIVRHMARDKIFIISCVVLLGMLCWKSFVMTGVFILFILCLFLFCYYGIRNSWYKALVKSEIQSVKKWKQVLEGSVSALYINSKDVSLITEVHNLILNDADFSKIINKHLNRRFRSRGNHFWFERNEKWIIETIQNKFPIDVFIGIKGGQEMVYLYTDSKVIPHLNITWVDKEYERLKELPESRFDLPWFLCRLLIIISLFFLVYIIRSLFP